MANQQLHLAQFAEQSSTPATPGAGNRKLYPTSAGWYEVNSSGTALRLNSDIGAAATKTVSSGVAAAGSDRHLVIAAESGTTDDLIEVTGLSIGERVYLRADTGDTITVKHNDAGATVKIHLLGDTDIILDEQNAVEFILVATNVLVQTGAATSVPEYPLRDTIWHDEATVIAGNALSRTINTSHAYGAYSLQNAAAINDEFDYDFFMAAGSYTLSVFGITASANGIVTWYVDDVSQGTQDWYSASSVVNVTKTTSITVIGDGRHVLRGKVASKNASSSNYFLTLTKLWIQ